MPGPIIVLTALSVEYNAVRGHLTELKMEAHSSGTLFEVGTLSGCPWSMVMAQLGKGSLKASVLASHAIERYPPQAVLLVGVAGSLAPGKVKQGDVVIATKTYWYHSAKVEGDLTMARPEGWPCSHRLGQVGHAVARESTADFAIHESPIASGEVVLNSPETPLSDQLPETLRQYLRLHYEDAVAIEMESAGMSQAAHVSKIDALTIRGISDLADGSKHAADAAGWQYRAAANAAAVARDLILRLAELEPSPGATAVTSIEEYYSRHPERAPRLDDLLDGLKTWIDSFVANVEELSDGMDPLELEMADTVLASLGEEILNALDGVQRAFDADRRTPPVSAVVARRAAFLRLKRDVPDIAELPGLLLAGAPGDAVDTLRDRAKELTGDLAKLRVP